MCNKGICKLEVHVFFVDFMYFIHKLQHCKYTCIIPNVGRPFQLPQVIVRLLQRPRVLQSENATVGTMYS